MTLRILHWLSRCILAGIFFYTGYIKYTSPLQFDAAISAYKLFPDVVHPPIVNYFPWVEIALAVSLLIAWKKLIRYVAGAAACLILFFIVILTITYARNIKAPCGCFSFDEQISPGTIARDGAIIIPALYLLAEPLLLKRLKTKRQEFPEPEAGATRES
jgi:hypothetical protein